MKPFHMVVWELTLRCNLACSHCGSRAGRPRNAELSTEEALDLVHQLDQIGVREVALIGGEAYLRPDWDIIAQALTRRGIYCSIVTGGRGLDATLARRMKQAGIVNVAVSIDGLPSTHDLLRGVSGSYTSAMGALRYLKAAGVRTSVNTQINALSLPELEDLFTTIAAAGIWAWGLQLTVAMGRAADHPERLLQPYQLRDLFPRLAVLKELCDRSRITFSPGNNIGYFGPYEHILRGGTKGDAHWKGCQAGTHVLGIEADGTLKGCPSLPTSPYAGGNVRERPLTELLRTHPLQGISTRDRDELWGYCRNCYYADICRGGCTWTSHVLFGRPGNNPYCHYRVTQLHQQGLRERLQMQTPAPGLPFDHGTMELILEPVPSTGLTR